MCCCGSGVSILARPFERALQVAIGEPMRRLRVSILARPFERALPGAFEAFPYVDFVSILARPFERALHTTSLGVLRLRRLFQSSPALSSGRYTCHGRLADQTHQSFNPRPPFRAGATRPRFRLHRVTLVSILARPFERALHASRLGPWSSPNCFNPRPPFRAGATLQRRCVNVTSRKFQSSPALSSGRYSFI